MAGFEALLHQHLEERPLEESSPEGPAQDEPLLPL